MKGLCHGYCSLLVIGRTGFGIQKQQISNLSKFLAVSHLKQKSHSTTNVHLQRYLASSTYGILRFPSERKHLSLDRESYSLSSLKGYSASKYMNSALLNKTFLSQEMRINTSSKFLTKEQDEEIDDLKLMLRDKSLGIGQKIKILLQQYGMVLGAVWLTTSVLWFSSIYFMVSRGLDVTPFLDSWGVFDLLNKCGFTHAETLKTSGASYWMASYIIYEILKPVRMVMLLFGTVFVVRYLRKAGILRPVPKSATMGDLVKTQSKLAYRQVIRSTDEYRRHYRTHIRKKYRAHIGRKAPPPTATPTPTSASKATTKVKKISGKST